MKLKKTLFTLLLVFIALDQLSKRWVESNLPFQEAISVLPMFSLYRTYNTGIAFSMLDWAGSGGLILLTAVIIGFMVFLWFKVEAHKQLAHLGFALVISGAIGNLIDRATQGHVIDFFLFHTENWAFAVFNVADAFITVGAIAIIIDELLSSRGQKKSAPPEQ